MTMQIEFALYQGTSLLVPMSELMDWASAPAHGNTHPKCRRERNPELFTHLFLCPRVCQGTAKAVLFRKILATCFTLNHHAFSS